MAIGVLILGESGTGKTHSIKGFKPEEVKIISLFKPILPFKGKYEVVKTERTADAIIEEMKNTKKKAIVIDDFQFLLGVPMMKRIGEKGWDKFNDIQQPYSDVLFALDELPDDTIVYFNSHVELTQDGKRKIKTIGNALDKYLTVEGLFMIVLGTLVVDGETEKKYYFTTQNNGSDTIKSPEGMFPAYAIDNDLKYVDDKIRNYYEIGDFKTDEELAEKDEEVKHEEITVEKKSRRARRGKEKEESTETSKEEESEERAAEEPKRNRRRKSAKEELGFTPLADSLKEELDEEREKVRERNGEKIANANLSDDKEEIPYEEAEEPELEELPKRKRRKSGADTEVDKSVSKDNEDGSENGKTVYAKSDGVEAPARRRRRRD